MSGPFEWGMPASSAPEVEPPEPPDAAGALVDHGAEAVARVWEQFKRSPNVNAAILALTPQFQALEDALTQLFLERGLAVAEGVQLDVIGRIVGEDRAGKSDDDYRRFLRARIATNRSRGVFEDMILVARLVLGDETVRVETEQQDIATVVVRLRDAAVTADIAAVVFAFLMQAKAAGVRLIVESSPEAPEDTFTWDIGPGWDDGAFADALSG